MGIKTQRFLPCRKVRWISGVNSTRMRRAWWWATCVEIINCYKNTSLPKSLFQINPGRGHKAQLPCASAWIGPVQSLATAYSSVLGRVLRRLVSDTSKGLPADLQVEWAFVWIDSLMDKWRETQWPKYFYLALKLLTKLGTVNYH